MVAIRVNEKPARHSPYCARLLFLVCVVAVQLWTQGSLTSLAVQLREGVDRHAALQALLREAEESVLRLKNQSKSCETLQRDRANSAAEGWQREVALKQRLELLTEDNEWLNRTVVSKDEALRTEQSMRMQLEASVHSLKEQMSLMQGQLVTAQQQQGTLHKHKHH